MLENLKKPFAFIKRKQARDITFIQGEISELKSLSDVEWDMERLIVVPFSQVREKNYEFAGSELPIISMNVDLKETITEEEFSKVVNSDSIEFDDELSYNYSDEAYQALINKIIKKEIGEGEGCNFVIPRKTTATIKDMSTNKALTIFKQLLTYEFGSHWTFIFFDGEQYFLGASPEAHLVVENKKVRMHPISGTFRKSNNYDDLNNFKKDLMRFLSDDKEINELFMVVDEELKMMARICDQGGIIVGPLLKEMSALIHTEYLLSGRSSKSLLEIFRETMFAATVVGGPLESACKINKKYEPEGREYYGSAIAMIGKNEDGPYLDSSILIRTLQIKKDGHTTARVGGTLVRNSDPASEVEEVKIKLKSALSSIQKKQKKRNEKLLNYFDEDSDILEQLYDRNKNLSKFWFFRQKRTETKIEIFSNKSITIIDNEDDFCHMIKHILQSMSFKVNVIRYSDYIKENDNSNLVIIGPGTGNPNNTSCPKMEKIISITKYLVDNNKKFIGICLGHQILCKTLGIKVDSKKDLWQGIPVKIDLFGKNEIVGFYNTFTGIFDVHKKYPEKIQVSMDKYNQIHSIRSLNFSGFQFHPESILTQNGYEILQNELKILLK